MKVIDTKTDKVIDLTSNKELFMELGHLVYGNIHTTLNASSDLVKNTNFYKEMQTTDKLITSDLSSITSNKTLLQKMFILMTQIAAESPMLKEVDFSNLPLPVDNLVEIAEALAESTSIEKINMSNNGLENIGIGVAKALAKSTSIKYVDFSLNALDTHAPEVIEAFTMSSSIVRIDMTYNGPGVFSKIEDQTILDEMANVFNEHNEGLTDFAGVKAANILSDSLHHPLIDLIGEYSVNNYIAYEV